MATSWHHDPLARSDSLRDLGGSPMVSGSGTKTMMHGRVIPDARELSLIQDGHEDRRPLDSHFGAWIVCTDDTTPFELPQPGARTFSPNVHQQRPAASPSCPDETRLYARALDTGHDRRRRYGSGSWP
jgi:hypothetical protein